LPAEPRLFTISSLDLGRSMEDVIFVIALGLLAVTGQQLEANEQQAAGVSINSDDQGRSLSADEDGAGTMPATRNQPE
jgi:hypothetical protein